MPKKAAGKEPTTPRGSASKAKKSVEQSPAAEASPKNAQPVVPSYYAERPTVASVRASLSNTSGPTQWFRDAYFHWELLTGCYSLDPWEKVVFNIVFWLTMVGILFYGFKFVSPLIQ